MEITSNASQTVSPNNNVLFQDVRVPGSCCILYQPGSGLVNLRGLTQNQCRARFRIDFTGNLGSGEETLSAATNLTLGICQNGELIPVSTMSATVADTSTIYNIGTSLFLDVPRGCCYTISVKNLTEGSSIAIQNANLIIERVA